ncbi:hypothetical protein FACS1894111_03620 [Clostridia bacterium]|nr:hypothetical protein FACS1894111_03620 [Clostridia bacterium]
MKTIDIYKIAISLSCKERKHWYSLFQNSVHSISDTWNTATFENFIVALYANLEREQAKSSSSVIAYGAGNRAQECLPYVLRHTEIVEIWDAYATIDSLYNIPVVKPHFDSADHTMDVVIFIDDRTRRNDVISLFEAKGYKMTYSYRDYIMISESIAYFPTIDEIITDETRTLFYDYVGQYEVIHSKHSPVNYTVIPKKLETVQIDLENVSGKAKNLSERLLSLLTITKTNIDNMVYDFCSSNLDNAFDFSYKLELFLRNVLANGIKTKERPIRMRDDVPYDQFAVFAVLKETLAYICSDIPKALHVIQLLKTLSPNSVPIISVECYYLVQCNRFEEALALVRVAMKKEPNALLASETFCHIAASCKENGILVSEVLPDYDLRERFCWSGLNFVLCSGFDNNTGDAEFLPCFRTLQCAANPSGEFWGSEEWVEFRRSILDGSFRYCQKNQCPNIAAGWLPKKSECNNAKIKRMLDGDLTSIPPIEELHLSYDFHCNLHCPSCRLEFKTNNVKQNTRLNTLFEKNLRPLLKNTKHLTLSGCGEAIISPHSKYVLQSMSSAEYPELAVELRTNVFSFHAEAWKALGSGREVIKHVAASIDASSKELFEQLRCPAKWDIVLQNLAFIQQLRNANAIDLFEFHVVVQTDNIDELVDIIKMAIKFDADVVTFSRLVNWRGMSEEMYYKINPFYEEHPQHNRLMQVIDEIKNLRKHIENGDCDLTISRKHKLFINTHCVPDPNSSYDVIRIGKLKIR